MKKVIIPQKMSGTGSIHDIASQNGDREINFPKGTQYAVVLSSYYGGKGYTTHTTEEATIQADKRNGEYSREIIGADGYIYEINKYHNYGGTLEKLSVEPYEVQDYDLSTAASSLGRIGGASTSDKKRQASAENGKKGGRPKKTASS